ncbi:MAG: YvrJ family protein [Oscillospiraceae bacterium]|nr:YvrJ family protein [Oscillospiraceae bacterium]
MSDFTNIVTSVGFPIAMCLWFMLRTEKVIKENTKATNDLCKRIRGITK